LRSVYLVPYAVAFANLDHPSNTAAAKHSGQFTSGAFFLCSQATLYGSLTAQGA